MTAKAVRLSPAARRDAGAIARRYRAEAGETVALDFARELAAAVDHVARQPASGSPRYAEVVGIAGLRQWPVRGFPYLLFYVEMPDRVRVLRILHGRRDIPASLRR